MSARRKPQRGVVTSEDLRATRASETALFAPLRAGAGWLAGWRGLLLPGMSAARSGKRCRKAGRHGQRAGWSGQAHGIVPGKEKWRSGKTLRPDMTPRNDKGRSGERPWQKKLG